jgi:tetratricopeptide (TPR) repeat protein
LSVDRYQGFSFAAADLSEDVDVDVERRKEILFHDAHLGSWDHWQLLGVPWNASAAQAKDAYLAKVKIFHPDRYAGRRTGSFRARLERVFRKLTEARDVLADETSRAAYARATAPPAEFARMEARRLEDERRAEERRARIARTNPLVARASRVQDLVRRGKAALAEGKFAAAANDLLLAQGMDPGNAALAALAADARKKAGAAKAGERFQKGLELELVGSWSSALAAYREALESDPTHARAAAHAARAALAVGDVASARALADAALKAAPRAGLAHEALGLVLEAEGNRKEARRALEKAIELDPKLETAKERLKKLRWSFLG